MDVLDVDELTGTVLPQLLLALSREKKGSAEATGSEDQAATSLEPAGEASHVCGAPHQQVKCATTPRLVSS